MSERRCDMPRGPREVEENAIVNVVSRGNNKRLIFRKEKDYIYYKTLLMRYLARYKLKLYHYCLMANHIHLLMKILTPTNLAKCMQSLQQAYFHYFRRKYGYVGRFWQGRFYSKLVEDDDYLLTAGLYIERNPVKAGMVDDPSEYKWSSYNVYAYGAKDSLVTLNLYYIGLGNNDIERRREYIKLMWSYLSSENRML